MKYRKLKWNELKIGQKAYYQLVMYNGKKWYMEVQITNLENNKVYYTYKHDNWHEYQTKTNFKEIGLIIEDEQLHLDI